MAFSLAGTINTGNYQSNWREFFDTYLSAMDGWSVSIHPSGDTNRRSLNFQFTDMFTGATRATDPTLGFWLYWLGTTSMYDDEDYSVTPGDTGSGSSNVVTISNVNTKWKVWTSDDNNGSIFVTGGGDTGRDYVFWWPHAEWIWWKTADWTPGTKNPNLVVCPGSKDNSGLRTFNAPMGSSGSSSEYLASPTIGGYQATFGLQYELYYKNAQIRCYQSSSQFSNQIGNMLCNDTYVNEPITDGGQTSPTSAQFAIVSDGVKYYWRSNTDLSKRAMLFDMGTTDPDTVGI